MDNPPPYSEIDAPEVHKYSQGSPSAPKTSSNPAQGAASSAYPQSPPSGYRQPPPGYYPPPPPGFVPTYGSTVIITQPPIIQIGACPACRVGILEDDFTCLGLMCAILFFPIGILCCLALKNRRCSNCGAYFA